MNVCTPNISWHGCDPVYSCAINPLDSKRLVTAGMRGSIYLWDIEWPTAQQPAITFISSLTGAHLESVNCVRWNSKGTHLASGSDDSNIFIWTKAPTITADSNWNVAKREKISIIHDPKGFVQGVAIHPWRKHIAAMSTDRSLRIYSMKPESGSISRCVYNIRKIKPANLKQENGALMFIDETSLTFFRRCSYLPDGSQLIVSAGCLDKAFLNAYNNEENIEEKDTLNNQQNEFDEQDIQIVQDGGVHEEKIGTTPIPAKLIDVNCAYVFATSGPKFDRPLSIIPIMNDQEVIAISVCPSLFPSTSSVAPYRMIFALITKTSLFFYDHLSLEPFAYARRIHLLSLTDGRWSHDGRLFIASSEDGYLTFVTFTDQCLGGPCLSNSDKILDDMMNNALAPPTTTNVTATTTTATPTTVTSSSASIITSLQPKKK
ncbi:unnamed protein product [Rotaria magnacalcarata]|uniref:CAF1B/HIR1 beta-propeller domain-containing protein n=1 Tax=Rotaria magnacalcarata TaxID=392030 RepID=A0A8S2MJV0_9BILA|nr:unnamed protein product [Rotaria magnacalcarata]CAF3948259.1 unnamed protein product [Rotaria magnacalcarata]